MDTQFSQIKVGFVIIGRNEGERLQIGLRAIQRVCPNAPVVYVDSGSDDGSIEFAKSLGIHTVDLDLSIPFTAARARNAGFDHLIEKHSDLEFVQFLDGDCELLDGWIETATSKLREAEDFGIVSGRRYERYPDASVYNKLIDIEWNTTTGETLAVLGDMCVKVETFKKINGFDASIIAAEDDDFCLRARRAGYRVFRINKPMSKHDANIMHLSQWYRRSKRGGHGYANIFHIHGNGPDKYFRGQLRSVIFWGGLIPLTFLVCLWFAPLISAMLLVGYLLFIAKIVVSRLRQGDTLKIALSYGTLIFTGKIYEFMGAIQYVINYVFSRKHKLIEYK